MSQKAITVASVYMAVPPGFAVRLLFEGSRINYPNHRAGASVLTLDASPLMHSILTLLIWAISQGLFWLPIFLWNSRSVRLLELELFKHFLMLSRVCVLMRESFHL
jgi:hypothetical protein